MNKKTLIPHEPDYATPPGWIIEEYMEAFNVGKDELAGHLGLDLAAVELLLAGKSPVTPEIAAVLEGLFQRPALLWTNMEAVYQKHKKRLETRGGKRPGAGRKPNPPRRYCISLPNALGRDLDARAKASGVTSYRWIVNTLKRELEAG